MDGKFLDLARLATQGSSNVYPVDEGPTQTLVRGSLRSLIESRPRDLSAVVHLKLFEDQGILEWEETAGFSPSRGRYRSNLANQSVDTCDAIEFEFDRLPPSKITQFLADRDLLLTPNRGLRRLDLETGSLGQAELPDQGDVLLFVHGTFSNSESMIAGLMEESNPTGGEFLAEAVRRYNGNVYVFDHPTLSVGPILNAIDLQRLVGSSQAKLNLVSHSRGGLVSRWWCETFDPFAQRCDKSVLVGAPLSGTGLAAPPNIRKTIHLLTQVSRSLQRVSGLASLAVPVFSVVEALLRVLTAFTGLATRTPIADAAMAMVPGLFSMSRVGNNPELLRLLESPTDHSDRYFAVQSDFRPTDAAWKFWRMFRAERIANSAADILFNGANDLVVDTESMVDLADQVQIPDSRRLDFGESDTVHHLNYFYQPQTASFLSDVLL